MKRADLWETMQKVRGWAAASNSPHLFIAVKALENAYRDEFGDHVPNDCDFEELEQEEKGS